MFSKACEYGIRATIYVAQQSQLDKKVSVKEIAEAIQSPEAFTGKIMQQLTKSGIVDSLKGPYGGFSVDVETIKATKLSDLIDLFDGEGAYCGCLLGLSSCDGDQPCPIHNEVKGAVEDLVEVLEKNSIYDMLYSGKNLNQFWLKKG